MTKIEETPTFTATLGAQIKRLSGPELPPRHVLAWLCADGNMFLGYANAFRFDVCPDHADADACDATWTANGDGCTAPAAEYEAFITDAAPEEE